MEKLDGRVAIVTGGGTGIGRSIALTLAREGANVVVCGRTLPNLKKVAEEIEEMGKRSLAIATDVSIKHEVQNMVRQTVDDLGRIDILVNNAAVLYTDGLLDLSEEVWDEVIDIDLKGVFLCTQAIAKLMMAQKYGKIINISSICGRGGALGDGPSYCVSKAGVIQLTQNTAYELGPYGINVNCIAPGLIITPMARSTQKSSQDFEKFLKERSEATVLRRVGDPKDIASVVVFLASEDSSFISGQTIPVDGGRTNRM